MSDNAFISADIGKLESFVRKSAEAITEFSEIRKGFEETNALMLSKWKGEGADAYKKETDHILENVGTVKDILEAMNETLGDIIASYNQMDADLDAYNRNPNGEAEYEHPAKRNAPGMFSEEPV